MSFKLIYAILLIYKVSCGFLQDEDNLGTNHYIEKIIRAGFEFEEHKVITKDGYINTIWRIPRKIGEGHTNKRKPIILQHGLLDDSWTWFALNTTIGLPFQLVETNFDVWLPNSRGNMFSTSHISADKLSYWNFSFHEMATYDLPANIEYVLNITGWEKLDYIGHSQGTFMFFLGYTSMGEFFESKVDRFVALGTVVNIVNTVKYILTLSILQ